MKILCILVMSFQIFSCSKPKEHNRKQHIVDVHHEEEKEPKNHSKEPEVKKTKEEPIIIEAPIQEPKPEEVPSHENSVPEEPIIQVPTLPLPQKTKPKATIDILEAPSKSKNQEVKEKQQDGPQEKPSFPPKNEIKVVPKKILEEDTDPSLLLSENRAGIYDFFYIKTDREGMIHASYCNIISGHIIYVKITGNDSTRHTPSDTFSPQCKLHELFINEENVPYIAVVSDDGTSISLLYQKNSMWTTLDWLEIGNKITKKEIVFDASQLPHLVLRDDKNKLYHYSVHEGKWTGNLIQENVALFSTVSTKDAPVVGIIDQNAHLAMCTLSDKNLGIKKESSLRFKGTPFDLSVGIDKEKTILTVGVLSKLMDDYIFTYPRYNASNFKYSAQKNQNNEEAIEDTLTKTGHPNIHFWKDAYDSNYLFFSGLNPNTLYSQNLLTHRLYEEKDFISKFPYALLETIPLEFGFYHTKELTIISHLLKLQDGSLVLAHNTLDNPQTITPLVLEKDLEPLIFNGSVYSVEKGGIKKNITLPIDSTKKAEFMNIIASQTKSLKLHHAIAEKINNAIFNSRGDAIITYIDQQDNSQPVLHYAVVKNKILHHITFDKKIILHKLLINHKDEVFILAFSKKNKTLYLYKIQGDDLQEIQTITINKVSLSFEDTKISHFQYLQNLVSAMIDTNNNLHILYYADDGVRYRVVDLNQGNV